MTPAPLLLRPLQLADETAFMEIVREVQSERPPWVFALDFERATDFADYVRKLETWSHGEELPDHYVPATFLVAVVGGTIVGRVSIRHRLNDFLLKVGGHIGYCVRPSHRGRGYATEMLRQSLRICAALHIDRALVTCDVTNTASRKVIENCGGVLENITSDPTQEVQKRRYWIAACRD